MISRSMNWLDAEFVQQFLDADLEGIELEDIVAAKILRMPVGYVKEYFQAGIEDWRPNDIVGFFENHIPASYVKGMYDAGIIDKKEIIKAF